jgi:hypothetical protein
VEGDHSFQQKSLDLLNEQIRKYEIWAKRSQWSYNISRILLVFLSATLPALTSNHLTTISTVTAVAVSAIAGLDSQFEPGEQWQHHRSAAINLLSFKLEYEAELEKCLDEQSKAKALDRLYDRTKTYLMRETATFWPWRIRRWRDGQ